MLLRDLDDFDKWKKSMENKDEKMLLGNGYALPGRINLFPETNPTRPAVSYKDNENSAPFSIGCSSVINDLLFVHFTDGSIRNYYSAEAVNQLMEQYLTIVKTEKKRSELLRDRCDNIQTTYNLQKKVIENADKKVEELNERIKILSDALTRSKMAERGKLILISHLRNQLNANTRRISKPKSSR